MELYESVSRELKLFTHKRVSLVSYSLINGFDCMMLTISWHAYDACVLASTLQRGCVKISASETLTRTFVNTA